MSMPFRSPVEIADQIVDWLEAALWTPAVGDPEAAFASVNRYHAADMRKALEDLLLYESRIAVVIPAGSRWETMQRENELTPVCRRVVSVVVMVSDRRIGNDDAAVFGAADNPGCLALAEIAIEACIGSLFGDGGTTVICVPTEDEPSIVSRDGDKVPGRSMVTIQFDCATQWQSVL